MKGGRIISERDIGDSVVCDYCSQQYRGDSTSGGFLFGSYAVCPTCAPREIAAIRHFGEEHFIKAHCPPEMSFHDWVMQLRDGNNKITIWEMKR